MKPKPKRHGPPAYKDKRPRPASEARRAAIAAPTLPTTTVPNPFWCPRRARP